MNSGFNENKAKFGVLVLAIFLEVLADSDGLINFSEISSIGNIFG